MNLQRQFDKYPSNFMLMGEVATFLGYTKARIPQLLNAGELPRPAGAVATGGPGQARSVWYRSRIMPALKARLKSHPKESRNRVAAVSPTPDRAVD